MSTKKFSITLNERRSFEDMIVQWGHWCVLRRFERGIVRSARYDAYYEESSRAAIQELTSGRAYSDHLMRMVKRTVVPGFEKRAKIGSVATPGLFFYLHASSKPTRQDWIMEVAQQEVRGEAKPIIPYRITRFYNIMDTDEYRMERGRIAYFRCRVEESNIGGPS